VRQFKHSHAEARERAQANKLALYFSKQQERVIFGRGGAPAATTGICLCSALACHITLFGVTPNTDWKSRVPLGAGESDTVFARSRAHPVAMHLQTLGELESGPIDCRPALFGGL
jgi:hypothetical protein